MYDHVVVMHMKFYQDVLLVIEELLLFDYLNVNESACPQQKFSFK